MMIVPFGRWSATVSWSDQDRRSVVGRGNFLDPERISLRLVMRLARSRHLVRAGHIREAGLRVWFCSILCCATETQRDHAHSTYLVARSPMEARYRESTMRKFVVSWEARRRAVKSRSGPRHDSRTFRFGCRYGWWGNNNLKVDMDQGYATH